MLRDTAQEARGSDEHPWLQTLKKLKGKIGHGGYGEQVFGPQLDLEFARRAGTGMNNSLSETIYRRLAEKL